MSGAARTGHLSHGSPLPRSYVVAWTAMAIASVGYLTSVALMPIDGSRATADLSRPFPDGPRPIVVGTVDNARQLEAAEGRAIKLKATLEDFQRDLALLRTGFDARVMDPGLVARLAAMEERLSIETGLAVARADQVALSVPAGSQAGAISAARPNGTRVAGAIATSDGTVRIPAPLETGSLQTPVAKPDLPSNRAAPAQPVVLNGSPPSQPSATAAPLAASGPAGYAATTTVAAAPRPVAAAKSFGVRLGSSPSVDQLRLSWTLLTEKHGEALGNLQPRVTQTAGTPEAGPIYDLFAGPFQTAADAKKACATLAARGIDCRVGGFNGKAL